MALNINDDQADRLVRELAEETGENLTMALRCASGWSAYEARSRASIAPTLARIAARSVGRRVGDVRNADEILGYSTDGPPT
jgi:antitoxin VapB